MPGRGSGNEGAGRWATGRPGTDSVGGGGGDGLRLAYGVQGGEPVGDALLEDDRERVGEVDYLLLKSEEPSKGVRAGSGADKRLGGLWGRRPGVCRVRQF